MRSGLHIYDSDTHAGPTVESLEEYLTPRAHELLPDLAFCVRPMKVSHSGLPLEEPFRHTYFLRQGMGGWSDRSGTIPRILGEAEPRESATHMAKFMGSRHPDPQGYEFGNARLSDMDSEGADVHMMVVLPPGTNDAELEAELFAAHHRWIADFCTADPQRLKSMIIVSARTIERSVAEIERWGDESWAVGIFPQLPVDYPIDHPDLDPLWEAAADHDLVLVHHSYSQGYPGYRDLWASPFLGRSSSHPWSAMRFVGAVIGGGILDRYPDLRFAILESGFGWLPFWANRLDDQAEYVGYIADIKQRPSEYLTDGRFFASIALHEGPDILRNFIDLMGDGVLMLGSDYPHPESRFPASHDEVLSWPSSGIGDAVVARLCWDNAVACFGTP